MSAVEKGRRSKYRKKGAKREQTQVCRKILFKTAWLCYSIEEADKAFLGELTRSFSVGADRGNKTRKQGFNIRWVHIPPKKFAANMYGGGKVGLVCLFESFREKATSKVSESGKGRPAAIPQVVSLIRKRNFQPFSWTCASVL